MPTHCLCGSNKNYVDCCYPFLHQHKCAPTALTLMRSRYCAYKEKNISYLLATWDSNIPKLALYENVKKSCEQFQWTNLIIIDSGANASLIEYDEVEFIAHYINKKTHVAETLHERSYFKKIENKWYYIEGHYPITKRNSLCPCGSKKKYKKCCGI